MLDSISGSSANSSDEDIKKAADKMMENLSEESFQENLTLAISSISNNSNYSRFLLELAKNLSTISNLPLQINCLKMINNEIESKKIESIQYNFFDIYAKSLIDNGFYNEAAKVYSSFPLPSDIDHEILEYYMKIGECYLNNNDYEKALNYLHKMSSHVFQISTPRLLLNKYDIYRGKVHIHRDAFREAANAFTRLWTMGETPEMRIIGLRNGIICAVLAPVSKNRSLLLHKFVEDENASKLDVFPILDVIVKGKFIDKATRDDFCNKIADVVGLKDHRTLESFSTQHNISVAMKIFSSIRIDRLAQLIGETPSSVEEQVRKMIEIKALNALIDQPTRTVEFVQENQHKIKDKLIGDFCQLTLGTATKLRQLI